MKVISAEVISMDQDRKAKTRGGTSEVEAGRFGNWGKEEAGISVEVA